MNENEIIKLANFILDNNLTIRKAASFYNTPKSTLHYNVTKKLIEIDYNLYLKLHKYLQQNFKEKHIRGGLATKNKYINYHKKQSFVNHKK